MIYIPIMKTLKEEYSIAKEICAMPECEYAVNTLKTETWDKNNQRKENLRHAHYRFSFWLVFSPDNRRHKSSH